MRLLRWLVPLLLAVAIVAPLTPPAVSQGRLKVVTTVAPITNVALNVGGTRVELEGIVPEGTDSHTFEPSPSDFGSEVFPSPVLEQIGREAGVRHVDELRDDDLPGDRDAPEHTYFGMMQFDVQFMAEALGGDPSPLAGFDPKNTFQLPASRSASP